MALKIRKASDKIEAGTIKSLIYGEPGIGKTTLGLTAPNPLLVDFDHGIRRVDPQFRTDNLPVNTWAEITELLNSPEELAAYDTLVIDTVGKLLEVLSVQIIKDNSKMGNGKGGLSLQGYGALLGDFRAFNAKLASLGKHVVYVAHDRENKDDEITKLRPDITGRSMTSILREMDLVGYMQSRGNKRTISFTPSDTYYGKNSCGLPPVIDIADLNNKKVKPMTDIFDHFKKMMDSQAEVMIKYKELLEQIERNMVAITDEASAASTMEALKSLDEIWDSRSIARMRFTERLSEIGLKYVAKENKFEKVAE